MHVAACGNAADIYLPSCSGGGGGASSWKCAESFAPEDSPNALHLTPGGKTKTSCSIDPAIDGGDGSFLRHCVVQRPEKVSVTM